MIGNLNDLNRAILALQDLGGDSEEIPVRDVIEHLRGTVVLALNPDLKKVIDFTVSLNLAQQHRGKIKLAPLGIAFLQENPEEAYELQGRQRDLLLRHCFFEGSFRTPLRQFIKKFSVESPDEIVWSRVDSEPFGDLAWIADHLIQLGVLRSSLHQLIVEKKCVNLVSTLIEDGGDFTEESLLKWLQEKKNLGEVAEKFVVMFEAQRLLKEGHIAESLCVKGISKIRINAGFDIKSFDGKSSNLEHDRFIEVKGSGKPSVQFYWSQNEIAKAKALQEHYWIYFVGGIRKKGNLVTRDPVLIQNPYSKLRTDSRFKIEENTLIVTAPLSGNILTNPFVIK